MASGAEGHCSSKSSQSKLLSSDSCWNIGIDRDEDSELID